MIWIRMALTSFEAAFARQNTKSSLSRLRYLGYGASRHQISWEFRRRLRHERRCPKRSHELSCLRFAWLNEYVTIQSAITDYATLS